jgi:preprotein translocase subunit SecY
LTVVVPTLEKLSKEGELGRKKISQYTRYLTVVLSFIQSFSIAVTLQRSPAEGSSPIVYNPGFGFIFITVLTLTTGTAFIMWLGEQISERGIGNGMSLIIFAGIVVGLPHGKFGNLAKLATHNVPLVVVLLAMMVAVVAFILVERAQRKISVQYAKRVVGRKVMGGQSTHLPLKVNVGAHLVIFASPTFLRPWLAFPNSRFFKNMTEALHWENRFITSI